LRQDRAFELLKIAGGLEPKLLDQPMSGVAVALERVGLAARPVEREHQLTDEALAQRMLADERLELRHRSCGFAERELRIDPLLESRQPRFLQPRDLRLGERRVREIGERGTAPQPQRLTQPRGRAFSIARLERTSAFTDERLKAAEVDVARLDLQQIPAPAGDQQVLPKHPPQVRDVSLNDLERARRRLLPPKSLDQAI
jgi:hypothetical protein